MNANDGFLASKDQHRNSARQRYFCFGNCGAADESWQLLLFTWLEKLLTVLVSKTDCEIGVILIKI